MPLPTSDSSIFSATVPASGPHLLDASMFWGPSGGVRRVLSTRHAALGLNGWRHTVMAPGARGAGHIDCGGLPLPRSGGYRLPLGRNRLARLIEAAQPDIIEVADPYTMAWAALQAGQRLGVPTLAFCHSNLSALAARWVGGEQGLGTRHGLWAARRAQAYLVDLYAGFDLVLAPSRGMARRLQQWGLRHVQIQPLGVDCDVFTPSAANPLWRRQIEQHLGVDAGTRLVLYTGRFAAEKNLQLLAQAVDLLGPGHLLLAVGCGPHPPRGSRVRVMPPMTDCHRLARLLANCDAYAHAGDQETFGLGALEAMACGVPVVLSASDGLGELAEAGGLSVPGRRPPDWADTLAFALGTDQTELCKAGLAHARAHDWSRVIEQMMQRYQGVLQHDAYQRQASRAALPRAAAQRHGEMPPSGLAGHD